MISLNHFLVLSAVIFSIGLYGSLSKKSTIAVLMGIELMLNSVNINLVAFNRFLTPDEVTGFVFAIFVVVVAAAEVAVALALVVKVYRERLTSNVDEIDWLKW